MFGYLTADLSALNEQQYKRYKSCYCGLCRSLKKRHGQFSRLTINYDVSFLILLLSSLYEPEEERGEDTCPRHPKSPQSWACSPVSDYAADMNLALAYLKCLDDWEDDGNIGALFEAKCLKAAYDKVEEAYPRQCRVIAQSMDRLHDMEKQKLEEPDAAASCFGEMMGEIFVYREDRWADTLRSMASALGRFIYLLDACMDLDADALRNRYNPLRRYYGLEDNGQRFRDILKMQLGECVFYFDKLPLVEDVGLLKNILCAGLWSAFNRKYGKRKES